MMGIFDSLISGITEPFTNMFHKGGVVIFGGYSVSNSLELWLLIIAIFMICKFIFQRRK